MTGEDEEEAIGSVVHPTHHHPSEPKNHEAEPWPYDGVPHYSLMEPLEALLLPVQPHLKEHKLLRPSSESRVLSPLHPSSIWT
ncbi:hypothetical protein TanjilG_31344 [Lupinus angustifolius]|uniref:Uncharacterized protein n=1 Tax=Lupinus angustifolius TaxID=3871 RepID=A0A4P1RUF4_LUPAN|nr:hypothetical protein TanjilG_31344 [Lupinus angustifolius]